MLAPHPLCLAASLLLWTRAAFAVEPTSTTPDRARIAELAGTLEGQARDLLQSLSQGKRSDRLISQADRLLDASRSFAQVARESKSDEEFLLLSFRMIEEESTPLSTELPEAIRAQLFTPIASSLDALEPLMEPLGKPTARTPPPDRDEGHHTDDGAPRLLLVVDGWHGPVLERFLRVKGKLSGVNLEKCDVVVTDAKNGLVYTKEDALHEISAHYKSRPFTRGERTTINFSLRFESEMLAAGENFITFTLLDDDGRTDEETVAAGR